jgi:hypothetical protein
VEQLAKRGGRARRRSSLPAVAAGHGQRLADHRARAAEGAIDLETAWAAATLDEAVAGRAMGRGCRSSADQAADEIVEEDAARRLQPLGLQDGVDELAALLGIVVDET